MPFIATPFEKPLMSIRKLIASLALIGLMLNLTGCPVMMAARVAKAASEKTNSDADSKTTPVTSGSSSSTQAPAQTTTPAK